MQRLWVYRLLVLTVAAALAAVVAGMWLRDGHDAVLTVSFLDVGQGDAIFIESPTGIQMLIDGGADKSVLRRLSAHMTPLDKTIDVVLATHPDTDHLGGLSYVLQRYRVEHVFTSGVVTDTPAYGAFQKALGESGARVHLTMRGTVVDLGGGAYVRVLFPDRTLSQAVESNRASAVLEVVYGEIEFLLTGDAPASVEEYVVRLERDTLASEVLKLGHHGSRTSTSELFVAAVTPAYAVISAGEDNRYGHPHREVLETVSVSGAQVLGTYEAGTVTFETDGERLWLAD